MTGRTCIVNLLIILFHRTDTFIGTNDIAEEDTWVNFDGTSISGNGFLYTMTNYPVSQPNGLTSQNCAIINPKPGNSVYTTNQTQDRSCTYLPTCCVTEKVRLVWYVSYLNGLDVVMPSCVDKKNQWLASQHLLLKLLNFWWCLWC